MAGIEDLSDEDLKKMYGAPDAPAPAGGISGMSDEELKKLYDMPPGPGMLGHEPSFWDKLQQGKFTSLYNPKSQLLHMPSKEAIAQRNKQPPNPRGMDLPNFGVGMSEAPWVTMAGAASPPLVNRTGALLGAGAGLLYKDWPWIIKLLMGERLMKSGGDILGSVPHEF